MELLDPFAHLLIYYSVSSDATGMISEKDLPPEVDLVWHGVNSAENLRRFLASSVRWAEVDLRYDARIDELVFHHDPLTERTPADLPRMRDVLMQFRELRRALKLDFKERGVVCERACGLIDACSFPGHDLWFNAGCDLLGEQGFRALRERYPHAILQCPADALATGSESAVEHARAQTTRCQEWGINRFSVSWFNPRRQELCRHLTMWNCGINLYDIPDLTSFIEAVRLGPRSVTADFNFPEWGYDGLGSGESAADREIRIRGLH